VSAAATPAIEVRGSAARPLGMTPARFLRDYWQKRPLLVRGAIRDFDCPLTPDDLAGLSCIEGTLGRLVRLDRRRDRWHLETGPFEESRFAALPKRDWTLLVQDVDRWDPEVRRLLELVAFLPRWRIDDIMVSYAAPGGSVGAHVDQYDVFLLQGLGSRRWQIDARPNPPLDFRDDAPIRLLKHFDASHDWVLAPGDMLYLPPGVPHYGVAEDACLTLSIGMRAPSAGELLAAFAADNALDIDEALRYADPDLEVAAAPGEVDGAALKRVRATLSAALALDDAAMADWFGRFLSLYRAAERPTPRRISVAQIEKRLARGDALSPSSSVRINYSRDGDAALLRGDGDSLPTSLALAQALTTLDASVDGARWSAFTDAERATLVDLVHRGWLGFS
jgi:50S ribosomal protein L16 3-hydroxylase